MTTSRAALAVRTTPAITWAQRSARSGETETPSPPSSDYAYMCGSALDAYIAGYLVTAYALSEHLSPFKLNVDVKDAVVTLGGVVDDKVLRNLAIVIAHDLDAVRDVKSEISIEAPAPHRSALDDNQFSRRFNDATLMARVKTRLLWNGPTHDLAINVSASNGVVCLSGTVASAEIRDLAERLALDVKDVLHVESKLRIAGEETGES